MLNFNGRVDKASVKNFQLIDEFDDNKIYMQFGRVGKLHAVNNLLDVRRGNVAVHVSSS